MNLNSVFGVFPTNFVNINMYDMYRNIFNMYVVLYVYDVFDVSVLYVYVLKAVSEFAWRT